MNIKPFKYYMKPTLVYLSDNKSRNKLDVAKYLADNVFNLSSDDLRQMVPSGVEPIHRNRTGWALTYLMKAGLISRISRATYQITEKGKSELLKTPEIIDSKYLGRYPEFIAFKSNKTPNDTKINKTSLKEVADENTPTEKMGFIFDEINNSLEEELLIEVGNQDPIFFENLVVQLLLKMGYGGSKKENGFVTQSINDEGIDGIISDEKLGFDKIYIQAKRWKENKVSRKEIQAFVGAVSVYGDKGVFITTSEFTKNAYEYVEKQTKYKIVLINGNDLVKYMIRYNVGVYTQQVFEIKKIDKDYFDLE